MGWCGKNGGKRRKRIGLKRSGGLVISDIVTRFCVKSVSSTSVAWYVSCIGSDGSNSGKESGGGCGTNRSSGSIGGSRIRRSGGSYSDDRGIVSEAER